MNRKYISSSCKLCSLQSRHFFGFNQQRAFSSQINLDGVKPFESIPGLSSLPLIGPLHHFLPVIGEIGPDAQLFDKLGDFRKKYGPVMKMKGVFNRADFVFLFEPEHFDQVYRMEESTPSRPSFQSLVYYREVMRKERFDGAYGLTTAEGQEWRNMRTKVNPAMLKPKIIKLYAPGLEEISVQFLERIKKLKDKDDYIQWNFDKDVNKWALESIAFVALGTKLGCLQDDLAEDHPASQLMKCTKDFMDLSFKLEITPSLWRYIETPNFKKIVKVFDTQWEISSMYLNKAKKSFEERGYDIPDEDKSIIEKLLAIDEKVAVMMAQEMLMAGIDTVAFATIAMMYRLAINPKTQEKLREEIRRGESSRYLKACLKETLRFWHVVPANLRRTTKDHVVAGYHIPKGVDVIAPNQYLSNLEQYYPRANEFLPERWLVDKNDPLYYGNAHPMVTLPFGFGVRSCIGRRIAELEIESLFNKLIDEFHVSWDGPPLQLVSRLLNTLKNPMYFKFDLVK